MSPCFEDVNVVFNQCYSFEYTKEIGLFDLFDVELLHGWVYDPQDVQLAM